MGRSHQDNTVVPSLCPHCHRYVSNPSAGVEHLLKIPVGNKGAASKYMFTKTSVAKLLSVTRERGRQLVELWHQRRVIEQVVKGGSVYQLSSYGYAVRNQWKAVGWSGRITSTQIEVRRAAGL